MRPPKIWPLMNGMFLVVLTENIDLSVSACPLPPPASQNHLSSLSIWQAGCLNCFIWILYHFMNLSMGVSTHNSKVLLHWPNISPNMSKEMHLALF